MINGITITGGAVSDFDAVFLAISGTPTVRAFGAGGRFVETAIEPGMTGTPIGRTGTFVYQYPNPYAYPASPYGCGSPYPPPYGSGYPANPYGYRPSYPYGAYPPAPQPPWWQRLLP
jgi:hypothetical protein